MSGQGLQRLIAAVAPRLEFLVMAAFAVTIATSVFTPIFNDEPGWKVLQARLLLDGFVNIHELYACPGSFASEPPWFMIPFRLLDAALYADLSAPLRLRIGGVLVFVVILVLLCSALPRLTPLPLGARGLRALMLALFGLGMLPLLAVINRPEQALMLAIVAYILAPLWFERAGNSPSASWLAAAAMIALTAAFVSQHPRAAFFLPLIVVSTAITIRRPAPRIATVLAVATLVLLAVGYWDARFACPEDPVARSRLQAGAPSEALRQLDVILLIKRFYWAQLTPTENLGVVVSNLLFGAHHRLHWAGPPLPAGWTGMLANVMTVAIILGFCVLAVGLVASHARTALHERQITWRAAIAIACLISVATILFLDGRRMFYESALIAFTLVLATLLMLDPRRLRVPAGAVRLASCVIMAASVSSQVVLWSRQIPQIPALIQKPGPLDDENMASFSAFGMTQLIPEMRTVARRCDIDPSRRLQHLVIDYITYAGFWQSAYRPLNIVYLSASVADDPTQFADALRRWRSAGVIARCDAFPPGVVRDEHRDRVFCCMPAAPP